MELGKLITGTGKVEKTHKISIPNYMTALQSPGQSNSIRYLLWEQ
jgi:hypothetical protein